MSPTPVLTLKTVITLAVEYEPALLQWGTCRGGGGGGKRTDEEVNDDMFEGITNQLVNCDQAVKTK